MIFISHDFGFLSHVVDEYYVLYGGFICEHITSKKQFSNFNNLHPYTQDLISSLIPGQNKKDISTINLIIGLYSCNLLLRTHSSKFFLLILVSSPW